MNSFVSPLLGVLGLGTTELVLILLVVLLLFGGAKLPSLARGLGQSMKEFKKASAGDDEPVTETKKTESIESAKK